MPIFSYQCTSCNKQVDRFRSADNRRMAINCPNCGTIMNFVEHPQDSVKPEDRAPVQDVFRKV